MPTELTVEEVREALDTLNEHGVYTGVKDSLDSVVAAARLWVDAAEPDYEAALRIRLADGTSMAIVNAALGITEDTR